MIDLLNIKDLEIKGIITSPRAYDVKTKLPDPNGIFSYDIFGKTRVERSRNFGLIQLPTKFFHPVVLFILFQKAKKYIDHILISNKPYVILNKDEIKDEKIKLFESEEEALEFTKNDKSRIYYSLYPFVSNPFLFIPESDKLSDTEIYLKELLTKFPIDKLVIDSIPVIPPVFRSDSPDIWNQNVLNNLYITIIQYSFTFTQKEFNPNDKLKAQFYNILTLKLRDLASFVLETIKGKQGVIRKNLFSSRQDFSGRAVITPDNNIKVDELGVPIRILVRIFEPYIIRRFIKELNMSIEDAVKACDKIYYNKTKNLINDENYKKLIDIIIDETKGKIVLTKRDPSIHRLSICGFKVIPVIDNTIHLHPLNTVQFNADFDGDTMAVFALMTEEAKEETKKLLNPRHSANPLKLRFTFNKDYDSAFKIFTLQPSKELYDSEENELLKDIWTTTKIFKDIETTKGVYEIFYCLPEKYHEDKKLFIEVFQKPLEKNKYLTGNETLYNLLEYNLDNNELMEFLNNVTKFLSTYMPIISESLTLNEFALAEEYNNIFKKELKKLKEQYKDNRDKYLKKVDELYKSMQKEILERVKNDSNIKKAITVNSVKKVQLMQILLAKGFITDWNGEVQVIDDNLATGFNEDNQFLSGQSARTGIAYRVIMTSVPGVIQRQMVMTLSPVTLDRNLMDCQTTKTVYIRNATKEFLETIIGRYIVNEENKLILLTTDNYKLFINKDIRLRSPIYCKSPKICLTCYGEIYHLFDSNQIGVLAATSIGERLYQEMMKVFHLGGVTELVFINPIDFLINEIKLDEKLVNKYLEYDNQNHILKIKDNCTIKLSGELFNELYKKIRDGEDIDGFNIEHLNGVIVGDNNEELPFLVPGTSEFIIKNEDVNLIAKNDEIEIIYNSPDNFLKIKPSKGGIDRSIAMWTMLTQQGKRLNIKDADSLLMILYNAMKQLGNVALIHYEVMLSHLLRNADDPYQLARLVEPYNAKLVSPNDSMALDSPLLRGGFMHLKAQIINGLVKPNSTVDLYGLESEYLKLIKAENKLE